MDDDFDTVRCNPAAPTTPADLLAGCDETLAIPRDSEWAGFSTEMTAILAEILDQDEQAA